MRKNLIFSLLFLFASFVMAQRIGYVDPKPLTEVVTVSAQPVQASAENKIPIITWGGDVSTIATEMEGIFANEGFGTVEFVVENNFVKQVESCLKGETPYLRGTLDMIVSATEVFKSNGIDLVVLDQRTWSRGGDAIVVRANIKKPSDIRTIGLQAYGPHMGYVSNVITNAGTINKVKFKYLPELTLPTASQEKSRSNPDDPVRAFQYDKTLDAVAVIIPDALLITNDKEGLVENSKILLTTKTASRIIADVYAVRSDYYATHRDKVEKLEHALMAGQERFTELVKNKSKEQLKYKQIISKSATLLLDDAKLTAETEGMVADAEFVDYNGNVAFFTGAGTTRNLKTLSNEIGTAFVKLGFLSTKVPLLSADWDYGKLGKGLKYATNVPVASSKVDVQKIEQKVTAKMTAEPTSWEDETLFTREINFAPNQDEFSDSEYADDFETALRLAQTNEGALVTIEGHSDPLGVLKAKEKRENPQVVSQMEQVAKNLSYQRAVAVKKSFMTYAKKQGIKLDESHFIAVGMGISSPKYSPPRTKEEWSANRRVVFRIKSVEAEPDFFEPLSSAGGK